MQQRHVGIQLASLRQPFQKALHTAARLGAGGVEIDARDDLFSEELSQTALRQLRKMLDDLNLRVAAVAFQTRHGYATERNLDRRVAATKRALRIAYQLGAQVVVSQIGAVPAETDGRPWELLVNTLTDLGNYGHHVGALLAAETGSESGADLKRLLEALPSHVLAVDLNPGKLILQGFSPLEAAQQLGPYIRHVHASDGVRDLARGRGVETDLGFGAVQFPELLGVLENHQYRGFFTIERQISDEPERNIRAAVQYLLSL